MNFTLAQLRTFWLIVRLGGFHAAARALNLTQPTVSQRVKELEREIGACLFYRDRQSVSLTAEGRALLDYAERILGTADEVQRRFRTRDPLRGLLRLGTTDSFALICLAELLQRLEIDYPDLRVSVKVDNSGVLSQLLNERELDIAFVSEPAVEEHVHAEAVGYNELSWIASPKQDLPHGVVAPNDLARFQIVTNPPPARLHTTVTKWFQTVNLEPSRLSICNNLSVIVALTTAGVALSVVPVRVVQEDLAAGRLRALAATPRIRPHKVFIAYQASEASASLLALVTTMRHLLEQSRLLAPLDGSWADDADGRS